MFSSSKPQLVVYEKHSEMLFMGLYRSIYKIDKEFLDKQVIDMIMEKFSFLDRERVERAFDSNNRDITNNGVSTTVFKASQSPESPLGYLVDVESFLRLSDEDYELALDGFISFQENYDDSYFDIFKWMIDNDLIEEIEYSFNLVK